MRCITAGSSAFAVMAFLSVAAIAGPAELMPEPLKGWTASKPVYGESVIEGAANGKRIQISQDYLREKAGVRISLNTHDARGTQLIAFINQIQTQDPAKARELASKGISPFPFGDWRGVMMASDDGNLSGAALQLGTAGTLTIEGILDGKPATVTMEDVRDYLERSDLKRMDAFVKEANSAISKP